jgi:RHS repeat-associated protein
MDARGAGRGPTRGRTGAVAEPAAARPRTRTAYHCLYLPREVCPGEGARPGEPDVAARELWVEHGPEGLEAVPYRFTGKELDEETGLYYYGARYLNPRTSRWISADPMIEDYLPVRPVDKDSREHNQNLPGMGGVFNIVNLAVYHYGGNNPIIFTDPTGLGDEPPKTQQSTYRWEASFLEIIASSYLAAGEGGSGILRGRSWVHFENVDTGESFEAMYDFELTSIGGSSQYPGLGAAAWSFATIAAEIGMVVGDFPADVPHEEVAWSFGGEVTALTATIPVGAVFGVSLSYITSKDWQGASLAGGVGFGWGLAEIRMEYSEPYNITTPTNQKFVPQYSGPFNLTPAAPSGHPRVKYGRMY